jgi:hypothetical protein
MARNLWFTSSTSFNMNGDGETTFAGLYSCKLNEETGRCDDQQTVTDVLEINGDRQRGIYLTNVLLNDSKTKVYAGHFDTAFEVLWAPLDDGRPPTFQSFFRTPRLIYTDKSRGQNCESYETRFAFYEVLPIAYTVDEDESLLISWEGYFQDCEDPVQAEKGLVWTVGISQVDPACTRQNLLVSFTDCTSVVSIFYRGWYGKSHRLATGFAMSMSPANRRLFYLTVQDHRLDGGEGDTNEVWVMPEGVFSQPNILSTPDVPGVKGILSVRIVPDASTIRLSLDENKVPRALCRTVYDQGVYCHSIELEDDGETIAIRGTPILSIGPAEVAESCTFKLPNYYTIEKHMSSISTGLEVIWGTDSTPELLLFGCYGHLDGHGNMTTIFRNGTTVQTMVGAYAGSINLGIEILEEETQLPTWTLDPIEGVEETNNDSWVLSMAISLCLLALILLGCFVLKRRRADGRLDNEKSSAPTADKKRISVDSCEDVCVATEEKSAGQLESDAAEPPANQESSEISSQPSSLSNGTMTGAKKLKP